MSDNVSESSFGDEDLNFMALLIFGFVDHGHLQTFHDHNFIKTQ